MNADELRALAERVQGLRNGFDGGLDLHFQVAAAFGKHQEVVPWGRHETVKEWDDNTRRWVSPSRPLRSLDDLVRIARPWIGDAIPPCPIKATAAALLARAEQE